MTNTPHELSADFPNDVEKIQEMKARDPHFAKLVEDYHVVNRAVHRAETRVEAVSDEHEAELRRKRSHLKDHIVYHLNHGSSHG